MSPAYFIDGLAYGFSVDSVGIAPSDYFAGFPDFGVRPVISLSSSAIKYGTGVIGNEFRISA